MKKETKFTIAMCGGLLVTLAAMFVYDRGYEDGYDDHKNNRPKYDYNAVRNGLIYDITSKVVPDSVARKGVDAFNEVRDVIFERYDAIPTANLNETQPTTTQIPDQNTSADNAITK